MAAVVRRTDTGPETAAVFRDTAEGLAASVESLVDEVSTIIIDQVPGVIDSASYRRSNLANLDMKLDLLRHGGRLAVPSPPHEAVVYARDLAWHGTDLSVLMHSYEVGHRYFWRTWTRAFTARADDPALLGNLFEASASFLFDYFDQVPAALIGEYRAELQRCKNGAAARHAELVCKLLGETEQDAESAGLTLSYPLSGGHVALLLAVPGAPLTPHDVHTAQRVVTQFARRLGARSLVVQAETATLWAWVEVPSKMSPDAVDELVNEIRPPDGVIIAAGDVGLGLEGFADSHREALHALRFCQDWRRTGSRPVRYRTISAVSLLSSDPKRAGRFMNRELGALAACDEATERVRSTLRAFLGENCNQARTARRLGIHYNTLVYRIRQAETLLGHSVLERRFELEAALTLHASMVER
ncbi:PucR family transcriptional regulator [Nonomuraea sp. 3N208]|uniref:PucR family transcriptional regulator n=1 Tax=Nonomuraea sp. 3N208 TaxID=3457421 RepID=UPI003FD4DD25